MFGYPGNGTGDLQNEYNFGALESATNRRQPGGQVSHTDPVSPQDVHVANVQNFEEYSPQETRNEGPPTSPMAFGPIEDGTTARPAHTSAGFTVNESGKTKKEGNRKHVMKEMLGMNKKSTKGMDDEGKRRVQLEKRWNDALAEEQRLNAMSQAVSSGEAQTEALGKEPNLPPKILCIHPLVYHDIAAEVPPARQKDVTIAFWNWIAVCILLIMNCGIAIGVGFAPYRDEQHKHDYPFNKALNTVLALVYLVGIPLSFILWYWRIYRACASGRPAQHLVAVFGLLVALAQSLFCFIGPRNYGACGIQMAIHIGKSRKPGVVAPVAIMTFLWLGEAGMTCYLLVKEWMYYRKDLAARRAARNAVRNATLAA